MILWDLNTYLEIWNIHRAHSGSNVKVKFSSDEKYIISTCSDGLLKLWSVQFGTLIEKFEISDESNTINISISTA